jgi:hypothetical protein
MRAHPFNPNFGFRNWAVPLRSDIRISSLFVRQSLSGVENTDVCYPTLCARTLAFENYGIPLLRGRLHSENLAVLAPLEKLPQKHTC